MDENVFETLVVDGKICDDDNDHDIDNDGNEVHMRTITAQAPMTASAKLRTRLRGGIVLRRRKRNILPLNNTHECSSSPLSSGVQGRTKHTRIFDISDSCSNRYHCSESKEVLSLLKLFEGFTI